MRIILLLSLLIFIGCEPPPKVINLAPPVVVPDGCFEVCVWIDASSGNHCLDGEEFHRLVSDFRKTPQDAIKTRYPNYEIVSMKRGQREYLSSVYEVYWVTLKLPTEKTN